MTTTLDDRLAIQDLLYRYARAADDKDTAAYRACFSSNGVAVHWADFVVTDGATIIDSLSQYQWTMHKVFNHAFEVEGDRARGYTYCLATHVADEQGQRRKEDWHVRYDDELLRENGQWRFLRREVQVGLIEKVDLQD
ncbi:nuclear transport factor 2 family protein [Pseudomonas sp. LS44]|uniref:nuclear transport factor 2 family protein n=1 Tax=Pseudomonas sp. LS44 TaxID=1357074 RepID=UPI00215A279C|nr:nuclear transport factor 2 family protein [Pseudomonas sp. LS44]UVE17437.1 nuclear transport factor 2 family protein [Pseudomonas sp. LS44]